MTETLFALDRASVRSIDADGHLHVLRTPISKANVCPYYGREIPEWEDLGLDAETVYQLYRDAGELEKAAPTFNGKQLLLGHKPVSAEDHAPEMWVGSVSNAEWDAPYLYARLDLVEAAGIAEVQSGRQEQLSSSYRYKAVMTPGTASDGTRYDGRMTDIVGNHVAIVPEGRAGPDVVVLDASLMISQEWITMAGKTPLSRPAKMAGLALDAYLKPKLLKGVALDSASFLAGITTGKTFRPQLPAIVANIKTKTAGKLAHDASVDDVQEVMEAIAPILEAEEDEDETVVAADEEEDDDEAKKKAKEKKDVDAKAAQDAAIAAATKDMVSKTAMDEAIATAVKVATDAATKTQREIRDAERFVTPWVGELAMAHDSAPAVYRSALKALKVDGADTLHDDALRPVLQAQPKPGEHRSAVAVDFAQDAASVADFDKLFPHANRLK